ncbi:MAG: hypothetical protein ACU843_16995, partial [Gammaproteobacteria bacterium]
MSSISAYTVGDTDLGKAKKCWLFHDWTKWKVVNYEDDFNRDFQPVIRFTQTRECRNCGKMQVRTT